MSSSSLSSSSSVQAATAALQAEGAEMRDQFALLSADLISKVDDIADKNQALEDGNGQLALEVVELNNRVGDGRKELDAERAAAAAMQEAAQRQAEELEAAAEDEAQKAAAALEEVGACSLVGWFSCCLVQGWLLLFKGCWLKIDSVSYTHLTLPTIYSV